MDDGIISYDAREPTLEERKHTLDREQLARSYKKIFASPDGKLVFNDLLSRCHIFHSTFNAANPRLQDFMEGQRALGLYIVGQLEIADLDKIKQIKETDNG